MSAYLVVDEGEDSRRIEVRRALVVGRGEDCDVRFADGRLSRRHVAVSPEAAGVQVQDLGSRNGTFVNGRRVHSVRLASGDLIQAGGVSLRCQIVTGSTTSIHASQPSCSVVRPADGLQTRVLPVVSSSARSRAVVAASELSRDFTLRLFVKRCGRALRRLVDAFRRERAGFGTGRAFTRKWRLRLVLWWLVGASGLFAWPGFWTAAFAERESVRRATLAAHWLAAATASISDTDAIEALVSQTIRISDLDSVRFVDSQCRVVWPATLVGRASTLNCSAIEALEAPVGGAIGVARVKGTSFDAAWIVTKSASSRRDAVPFWLVQAAILLASTLGVWMVSRLLVADIVGVIDRFAERVAAAAEHGADGLACGHSLPALERIAGLVALLLARHDASAPPCGRPHPIGDEGPSMVSPPVAPLADVSPATAASRASLIVNDMFIVERVDGAAAAFGVSPASAGQHVLDALASDGEVTNTVLALLAAHARGEQPSKAAMRFITASGTAAHVELTALGRSIELVFSGDRDAEGGDDR